MCATRLLILAACALGALGARQGSAEVYLTAEQALQLAFPHADSIDERRGILTGALREQVAARIGGRSTAEDIARFYTFHVVRRSGRIVGAAVIDDVLGKSQPITYMAAVDVGGSDEALEVVVKLVEILAYRESHGGEVRQARWRQQFVGKGASDAIRVGRDVRNIAGATISCRAVADGVRRNLAYLEALLPRELTREPAPAPGAGDPDPDPARPAPAPTQAAGGPVRRARVVMGTTLEIECHSPDRQAAARALDAALAEVDRLDRLLSTYQETSEVSQLNRAAGGRGVACSPELREILERSESFRGATGGAFDITVAPLVSMWRAAEQADQLPQQEEEDRCRALCGAGMLELPEGERLARLTTVGAAVDLGGIGKGYALDRAAAILREHGVASALLDFGGQVLALDAPPHRQGWPVEIRDPRDRTSSLAAVDLVRISVATTADDARGLTIGAERFSHVIDPRSGRPARGLASASVLATDATTADALSTAIFVLGREAGLQLARERDLAVLLLDTAGKTWTSPAYDRLVASPPRGGKR